MSKKIILPAASPATVAAATFPRGYFSSGQYAIDAANLAASVDVYKKAERVASGRARPLTPPKVTRGERIPATLRMEGGKVLEVPARRGWGGDAAFIDWLNVTVHEDTFTGEWLGDFVVTDDQLILECSALCENIFGFGITQKREKGANFYHRSYVLGDGYGMVCHGGQRNSLLISLTGDGCNAALDGWEGRLFTFLKLKAVSPKITRIDLSHDVLDGVNYSVDRAFTDFDSGLFSAGGRTPDIEQRGNWHSPNGKGRTLYIGHRSNGKYARIYEKGKQLGDASSLWVRVEVELKSVDRIIPFDVLLRAGEYLAATYPALEWISERQERIKTSQKSLQITYEKTIEWVKRQCGSALWVISMIEGGADNALSKLVQVGKVPARLVVPHFECEGNFIHIKDDRDFFTPEDYALGFN